MPCTHLKGLLEEEANVIKRHLEEFMKHKNIRDSTQAKEELIHKYGWIMREMYCDFCPDKKDCDAYENIRKKNSIPTQL